MVAQAAVYVKGRALSVTLAAAQAPLELNMMMPLIAYETQDSLALLTHACRVFRERCVEGLEADGERCAHWIEWSLALVTPLATRIGYDRAAQIAYQAFREGKTVRQVALEQKVLSPAEIEAVLDPRAMLGRARRKARAETGSHRAAAQAIPFSVLGEEEQALADYANWSPPRGEGLAGDPRSAYIVERGSGGQQEV
jgi:aspartate ammonia-lyase